MNLLMVVSHQVEEVEALGTAALLTRAGFTVFKGTFEETLEIHAAHGTRFFADGWIDSHDVSYEGIIIPGGKYVQDTVDQDTQIKALLKTYKAAGKYLMALCAGPRFLMQADVIEGAFTCFPGAAIDRLRGTYWPEKKSVVDEHLITARSVGAVYDFVFAIIETLKGREALEAFQASIHY